MPTDTPTPTPTETPTPEPTGIQPVHIVSLDEPIITAYRESITINFISQALILMCLIVLITLTFFKR